MGTIGFLNYCKIYIKGFLYGLRSADTLLNGNANVSSLYTNTEHTITVGSVWADLLRGELTQQVKQLRYSLYLVTEKAEEYKYIGNGVCIKRKAPSKNKNIVKQIQRDNTQNYTWALQNLKGTDHNSIKDFIGIKEKKLITLEYFQLPQFNFTNAIISATVNKDKHTITLYFSTAMGGDVKSKRISKFLTDTINAYEKLETIEQKNTFVKYNILFGNIKKIHIETYKADGEYDNTLYDISGMYVTDLKKNETDRNCVQVVLNYHKLEISNQFKLEDYYDQTQDDLYQKKAQKADTCIEYFDAYSALIRKNNEADKTVEMPFIPHLDMSKFVTFNCELPTN